MYFNYKILIFFLSFSFLQATEIIKIDYSNLKKENFTLEYIVDSKASLTNKNIQNQVFHPISNCDSVGYTIDPVWIKMKIENTTKLNKNIFIHNDFAYFSKIISIYEYENNTLFDQNKYTIQNKDNNSLIGSTFVYPLNLKAYTTKTLYFKIEPFTMNLFDFKIYDEKSHIQSLINKNNIANSIVIILFTLAFYNALLFILTKNKVFFYYALYLINSSLGFGYMYGSYYHSLELYGDSTHLFNITAVLVASFLFLFVESIFKIKKSNKNIYVQMQVLYFLTFIDILIALFYDIKLAVNISSFIFALSFIIIIEIAFHLHKKQHPLKNIFISAYSVYIISLLITILALYGIIPLNTFSFYASGFGLIIEALLFSYLLHYHIKSLEEKLVIQQNQIILKNQKAQMGGMMGAITHQWKQPLTTIGSIVMLIKFKLENNDLDLKELEKKIDQIDSNIYFLAETIDDFKNFLSAKKTKTKCNLDKLIQRAIDLSSDEIMANDIIIHQDLNFTNKTIELFENELLHIILNIIQNAKEAFKENKARGTTKMIKIIGNVDGDATYINIIDNAGGISPEQLPRIFEENYTTKQSGTGLGLYLSKVIIEEHLGGSIEATNIGDGTMFRIRL